MNIVLATMEDFDGILALHRTYHTNYISDEDRPNGFVTTNFTDEQLETLIVKEKGVMLAKTDDGQIVGYATAASWDYWAQWPLFTYMIEHLEEYSLNGQTITKENSYQYGPVCVHTSVRGTGVFEAMFKASLASMKERYPIMATFINQINPRSYAAHTRKVHMTADRQGAFRTNPQLHVTNKRPFCFSAFMRF